MNKIETKDLIIEELKKTIDELLKKNDKIEKEHQKINGELRVENKELKEKNKYLKEKIENKNNWCQLIADIGYDYDGYRKAENLMPLIAELVKYSLYARDDFEYEEFLKDSDVDE